jgi:hypothetical protein
MRTNYPSQHLQRCKSPIERQQPEQASGYKIAFDMCNIMEWAAALRYMRVFQPMTND